MRSDPQRYDFRASLAATGWAWLAASVTFIVVNFFALGLASQPPPVTELMVALLIMGALTPLIGLVIFFSCVIVTAPLLALLPRRSRWWNPDLLVILGIAAGPLMMFLVAESFALAVLRTPFIPDFTEPATYTLGSSALMAGIVFGSAYGKRMEKRRAQNVS